MILSFFNRFRRREDLGLSVPSGGSHYRAYVGPPEDYDLIAAGTFSLLTALGLRERHYLLDIGCGSLRIGRLLIPYLQRGHYSGIEPNEWLVKEGIRQETGRDQVSIKEPAFYFSNSAQALPHDSSFDFVLAQSIFSHAGTNLVHSWLLGSSAHLKNSGALVANFLSGEIDTQETGWTYPECVYYRADTLRQMGEAAGFRFFLLDWAHPRLQWALFAKPGLRTDWIEQHGVSWNAWLRTTQGH